jgi:hypothetical protein
LGLFFCRVAAVSLTAAQSFALQVVFAETPCFVNFKRKDGEAKAQQRDSRSA